MRIIWAILVMLIYTSNSWAYCSEPSSPDAPSTIYRPTKPSVPYCVNTYINTHTCDDWEIDSYNAEIEQYNAEVEEYVDKLKYYISEAEEYLSEVVDYAKCEIRNID